MKLSVVITGSYDADPIFYTAPGIPHPTGAEMASVDLGNINSGAVALVDVIDWLEPESIEIDIRPNHHEGDVDIPESDKITPRPVWARHQRRHYLKATLDAPTEEEMHDAILVLSDPDLQTESPDLYLEAFSILVEEH